MTINLTVYALIIVGPSAVLEVSKPFLHEEEAEDALFDRSHMSLNDPFGEDWPQEKIRQAYSMRGILNAGNTYYLRELAIPLSAEFF